MHVIKPGVDQPLLGTFSGLNVFHHFVAPMWKTNMSIPTLIVTDSSDLLSLLSVEYSPKTSLVIDTWSIVRYQEDSFHSAQTTHTHTRLKARHIHFNTHFTHTRNLPVNTCKKSADLCERQMWRKLNWQLTKNRIGELFFQGRHILHSCFQHHEVQKQNFPRFHFFYSLFLLEKKNGFNVWVQSITDSSRGVSMVLLNPARPVARTALIYLKHIELAAS